MAESAKPLPELSRIDSLLEHRVRLAVCVLLSRHDAFSFTRLKEVLLETDGSLGAHLKKLEDAGYLTSERTMEGRRPTTWYQITAKGRRQLDRHLSSLTQLMGRMK